MEITGFVEAIEKENNNGHDKKVVTLKKGNDEKLFIEFQGKSIQKVIDVELGQQVSVRVRFNGKVSGLGRRYNNIIGKSIKKYKNENQLKTR